MLERQKIILFYLIFTSMHLHRETYFQSFDKKLIFNNKKKKGTNICIYEGKRKKNRYSSHGYTYIQTMHVGTILCQYVCRVVSSPTINRLFLARPQKWFVLLLSLFSSFFFDIMFTDNFSFASFIDTTVHVMRTYTYIYIYRQSCLSSVVEMIIINDHGSLVVCCWQYLFSNTHIYIYMYIYTYYSEKKRKAE